jgi:uroporphyrinogen decarboxylase
MIKNDLYLRALRGETVERPPVWMMRQAGRYLPEFIALRDQYDFFTRCQTPELAAEITVQPIRRFPLDAAILFSDILVVPQAMGIDFKMKESVGPWLDTPIRTLEQVENLQVSGAEENLKYVYDAIDITLQKLENEIPLIGFAGSPWTLLCYCVEGKGSKSFDIAKSFVLLNQKQHICFCKKLQMLPLLILREKYKVVFLRYKFLILGAECFLQKIIKNFLGNTLIKL